MQITISARHGQMSESTRERIQAKVERLQKYFERLTAIEVTVNLEDRERPSIDLRVSAEHKHDFVATEVAGELIAAVDGAFHKLEQQLRKYKERVQDHHR